MTRIISKLISKILPLMPFVPIIFKKVITKVISNEITHVVKNILPKMLHKILPKILPNMSNISHTIPHVNASPKLVAPFKVTKWLMLSSMSFLIPAIYGFYSHSYGYTLISTTIFICSVNFWRDARHGMRRTIDIYVAHTGALLYIINGIYVLHIKANINMTHLMYIIYPTGCTIYAMNHISTKRYYAYINKHYWLKYHMIFHILCGLGQCIVIYCNNNALV
jgi:hypothetical protein